MRCEARGNLVTGKKNKNLETINATNTHIHIIYTQRNKSKLKHLGIHRIFFSAAAFFSSIRGTFDFSNNKQIHAKQTSFFFAYSSLLNNSAYTRHVDSPGEKDIYFKRFYN
jgi:hypothetical protein